MFVLLICRQLRLFRTQTEASTTPQSWTTYRPSFVSGLEGSERKPTSSPSGNDVDVAFELHSLALSLRKQLEEVEGTFKHSAESVSSAEHFLLQDWSPSSLSRFLDVFLDPCIALCKCSDDCEVKLHSAARNL